MGLLDLKIMITARKKKDTNPLKEKAKNICEGYSRFCLIEQLTQIYMFRHYVYV